MLPDRLSYINLLHKFGPASIFNHLRTCQFRNSFGLYSKDCTKGSVDRTLASDALGSEPDIFVDLALIICLDRIKRDNGLYINYVILY